MLSSLDRGRWVRHIVQSPRGYPEELESVFRSSRSSVLDELFKEPPALTEPLDELIKNGKYLTDTQLKNVLSHLGLSALALVNALNVDAPPSF